MLSRTRGQAGERGSSGRGTPIKREDRSLAAKAAAQRRVQRTSLCLRVSEAQDAAVALGEKPHFRTARLGRTSEVIQSPPHVQRGGDVPHLSPHPTPRPQTHPEPASKTTALGESLFLLPRP